MLLRAIPTPPPPPPMRLLVTSPLSSQGTVLPLLPQPGYGLFLCLTLLPPHPFFSVLLSSLLIPSSLLLSSLLFPSSLLPPPHLFTPFCVSLSQGVQVSGVLGACLPPPRKILNRDPLRLLLTQSETNFLYNILMTHTYVCPVTCKVK